MKARTGQSWYRENIIIYKIWQEHTRFNKNLQDLMLLRGLKMQILLKAKLKVKDYWKKRDEVEGFIFQEKK
eukprot:snap_masked-scaffold_59-processed-gene-0.78-mRNA-1 protein AED:1.00 eAED:1.00 QI:0/-1/0/0/-1/1/1/0/70